MLSTYTTGVLQGEKNCVRKGDRDKAVQYELSRGGCVTSDDEVALSNYVVNLQSQNDVILENDMEEELNNRRNGGDSDDDGDNARNFDGTMMEV